METSLEKLFKKTRTSYIISTFKTQCMQQQRDIVKHLSTSDNCHLI